MNGGTWIVEVDSDGKKTRREGHWVMEGRTRKLVEGPRPAAEPEKKPKRTSRKPKGAE